MTRAITALAEIAERFDAVLADQFGVLHDGVRAFEGALAAMAWLGTRGIPIAVLTNSGRSPVANAGRLSDLGFLRAHYREAVTSGGLATTRLAEMLAEGTLRPGDEILVVASVSGSDSLDSLPLKKARSDARARLVLITGADPLRHAREEYAARLRPLAERGIPALCCNPDHLIYAGGAARFGPGRIADDYRSAGGSVAMLGKPGLEMFRAGLRAVGNPPAERCLVIGDSPAHDIAGAKRAGCQSLLITSGVQSDTSTSGVDPDYRMPSLRP